MVRGTGEGGIEPTIEVLAQHLLCDVAQIQEYIHPLATLRLVAGHRIGIFHLQHIIVWIHFHLLHPLGLGGDVRIVFPDSVEELVVERLRQGRCVGLECI